MNGTRAAVLPLLVFASSLAVAPQALAQSASGAPSKVQCVDADTKAQQLRRQEKLIEARAQLKICVEQACPALIRDDCAQRLDELNRLQPTLVFDVKDGAGHDLTEVKVSLDEQPLVDHVSGAAIPVDPGAHSFTFEVQGEKPVTMQLVLREAEVARHVPVTIGAPPPVALPPPDPTRGRGQRTAGLVVGGFGVAGIGIGALFGVLANSKWQQAKTDCPSSSQCTKDGHDAADGQKSNATTLATVSTISFIAGGVLAAGGLTLFLTAPSPSSSDRSPPKSSDRSPPAPARGALLGPLLGPGHAGVMLQGWF